MLDIEYDIEGYHLIRKDRDDKKGGGVAIYINTNKLSLDVIEIQSELELIVVKVKQNIAKPFYVAVVYRPPGIENISNFFEKFEEIIKNFTDEIIITGDINLNILDNNNPSVKKYIKLYESKGFTQTLSEPTRCTSTSSTLIDHILCNKIDNISGSGVLNITLSDHKFTYLKRKLNYREKQFKNQTEYKIVKYRDFKNLNFSELYAHMDNELTSLYNSDFYESNKFCDKLIEIILSSFNMFAPIKEKKVKSKDKFFINSNIRKVISEKNKCYSKLQYEIENNIYNAEVNQMYNKLRNYTNLLIRKSKCEYYSNILNKNLKDPKKLWKTISQIIVSKRREKYNQKLELDVNKLNNHFINSTLQMAQNFDNIDTQIASQSFSGFLLKEIKCEDILKIISSMNSNKSCGYDGLTITMIKICSHIIVPHLKALFDLIIKSKIFPNSLKIAKITPIFKGGQKSDLNNYRPISVLPIISNIFEKLLCHQMREYLLENRYII